MTFLQGSTINRKSFRHRKVDNKKPLRIYTPGEINEDDCIPVSRAGIEIETGVEKEEEEEYHLVNALKLRTESMERGATASGKATIPVPTSSRRISYYADVYQTHKWKKPSTYVKFSLPVEECIGCLYCMDERDDIWLAEHKQKSHSTLTEDQFEEIMQHFENVAKNKPQLLAKKQFPSWQDYEACLPESLHDLRAEAEIVYTHWKAKRCERVKQYQKVGPLMFEIKTQEGKDEEDHPWTCFRRRELKPIRRTRRTETASFDKLRKIRKDIHSGRHIMVNVTVREKTKKQKIELDRKIFEKECTVRELRKKLGIRNETSHEHPKRNRKSSFAMDLGATKTKSGIKLSKKDDEYPMTDITDFPYLIQLQRRPTAGSFFRKFDSLKPTDRTSISCTAFRSRFGRGGRRRRIIDRLDVFSYRRIRENERYKYDSDEIEEAFSDDEMNQLDSDEDDDKVEDYTENMIRFHLFKEEDYQNLGVYRRIQKEKQNSPTKQQSLDALTGNNIPAQNPQHTPLVNTESRQMTDPRFASTLPRSNSESRTTSQVETRPNQDSRQKLDADPRTSTVNMVQRNNGVDTRANISNISSTFIDPRNFNGVNRNQGVVTDTSRDPRLNSNPPSTPRLSNDPRIGRDPRLVNSGGNLDPRAHNGLILRSNVTTNHRDNATPYRRPAPRNIRMPDDSSNTIGGVTNGMTPTSLISGNTVAKNHVTAQNTSVTPINSPSNNSNTNSQGNGDGLTRTSSNSGMVTNGQIDPKVFMSGKILNLMSDQSKIPITTSGLMNSANQIEAQKINNQRMSTTIQSTSTASLTQLDPDMLQRIINLKTSNPSSNVSQQINNQNNQLRQSTVQTSRQQNITVPSVGSNIPSNSAISPNIVLSPGMVQNVVQSSGSTKSVISAQNFFLSNSMLPTSGSSNVRQNGVVIPKLRHNINMNQNGINGSPNINLNTNVSIGNNVSQTINMNPNVSIGTNGSQQAFVHMSGVIPNGQSTPMRNMGFILSPANNMVGLRQNVLSGNGSAHLANMVLPNTAIQASNLANLNMNHRQLVANVGQVSTNGAAIRQLPNGAFINTNVIPNNGANFGQTNLLQMRPSPIIRQSLIPNGAILGNPMLANGTNVYDILSPSPRQNNVSPASVSTSNGGNNSVGTPSPQPQAEQRTVL